MAKISPIWGAMSGSIRGVTYSHNKGGAYVRGRTIPTNPTTTKQASIRTLLSTWSGQWSQLTDAERTGWNDWAQLHPVDDALGVSIFLSGQQAFTGANVRLALAGATPIVTPPPGSGPSSLTTLVVTATAPTGISAVFTPTPGAATDHLLLWMTLPAPQGRNPNFNQARLVGIATAQTSPEVFVSPYPAVAAMASNFYGQVMNEHGQVSPVLKARASWV